MRSYHPVLCVLVGILSLSCATATRLTSASVAESLITAPSIEAAAPSIALVLGDVLNRTYRFDDLARRETFDTIIRLRMTGVVDDLRRVATMPLSSRRSERLLDVVAISGALRALTELGDSTANALNVNRLQDEELRGFAFLNLSTMRAFDAVDAVVRELESMAFTKANGGEVATAIAFVEASGARPSDICVVTERIAGSYSDCSKSPTPSYCNNLMATNLRLSQRFCGTKTP